MWIKVKNDNLQQFKYTDYGMTHSVEVTANRKAQVTEDVAERLFDHPSGDFESVEETSTEDNKIIEVQ